MILRIGRSPGKYRVLNKIRKLIEDIEKTPFEGLGKPEALKYNLSEKWARRITEKDRLVYEIFSDEIKIYSLKVITRRVNNNPSDNSK